MSDTPHLWSRARAFAAHTTWRQKAAAPLLYLALGVARAMVLLVPFRVYAPLLGEHAAPGDPSPPPAQCPDEGEAARIAGRRARRLGGLIEALAGLTPWTSNCLVQTIVAALCLRVMGIGYAVHFGVARSLEHVRSLEAHSWVMAGDYPVTGYRDAAGMTCVHSFHRQPPPPRQG